LRGLNVEGLKRRGVDKAVIDAIRKAYKIAFNSKLRTEDALATIRRELPAIPEIDKFASFIAGSQRGVCR
jgi:UDP-N-acetylglucosamine acyltransferase